MRPLAPGPRRAARRRLIALAALWFPLGVLSACSSPWETVRLGTLARPGGELTGRHVRFHLDDGRMIELQITDIADSLVEGHRYVGEYSTERRMRIDLRHVVSAEMRRAGGN